MIGWKYSVGLRCVALLLLLGGLASCRQPSEVPDPNIVFITIDTTRADHLGWHGYFRDTSPVLDALAAESIVFERCYTPMATTFPSHFSLFTGVYPIEHGALGNPGATINSFVAPAGLRTLPQLLDAAGYLTAGFVSAAPLKAYTGISEGFDVFDQTSGHEREASRTNAVVLPWLKEKNSEPFFLWVHYFDPHIEYRPPERFAKMFASDQGQQAYLAERAFMAGEVKAPRHTEEMEIAQLHNLYDGEIRFMDDEIGTLLSQLRADRAAWRRTVVVVVADHGEGLGQHDELVHGGYWNEQLHVPLMIRIPWMEPRRIRNVLSMVDVVPTLLSLIDLRQSEIFLEQASGRSRLAAEMQGYYALGQESEGTWRTTVHGGNPHHVLIGSRWKFIYRSDGDARLFDLDEDPYELRDVAGEHPDLTVSLREQLLTRLDRQARRREQLRSGNEGEEVVVEPETTEQLRALGYLD